MLKIVKISYADGEPGQTMWVQGFDVTGSPILGINKIHAHKYAPWAIKAAVRNTRNAIIDGSRPFKIASEPA